MAIEKWAARVAAGMMGLALASPAWAGAMSKVEFRMEVRDAIHKLSPKATIQMVGDDSLRVQPPGAKPDDGMSVFLGNAYERYLNDPEALETIVGQITRTALAADLSAPVDKDRLVVLIRPVDYVTQPGFDKIKFLIRPFAGDFIKIVAIDDPETFRMGSADDVRPLFADDDALWAQAEANTRARMGKLEIDELEPGVWTVTNDTSLALNFAEQPDLWRVHGVAVTGDPVVVFLQRNLLLLVDGGDKDRVQRAATFASQLAGEPEIISTTMFTRHNGVWSVLEQRP